MNQIGLRFSLQHDEHLYLWFVSFLWTTCLCIEPIKVNGNVGVGTSGDGGDGMSTTNRLFLAKLIKKSFSQHAQINKFIESLHEFNLHEKKRVGKMCKPGIRKGFMITHQLPFRKDLEVCTLYPTPSVIQWGILNSFMFLKMMWSQKMLSTKFGLHRQTKFVD